MFKNWLNSNIIGFSIASFFNDFCHEMTTALLPSYISQISGAAYAPLFLGLIQGVADVAATGMKLVSGLIADRAFFYKPYLIIGYGLTSVVGLIGTTSNIALILFYKSVAWMARGLREPIRDTWISKIVTPQFYGRAFGFHRACDTLGALVGPLCAFIFLKFGFSLTSLFLFAIIPGMLSTVPIIFLTHENKKEQPIKNTISFMHQIKKLPSEFNYFIWVMFVFGIANFNQVLFLYRAQEFVSAQSISSVIATGWALLLYIIFNFIRGLSEFGMGALSDYYNRRKLLALFGFGFFSLTSIFFMIPTTNKFFLCVFFACAGLSAGTVKSLEKSYAATLLPEDVRGVGLGVLQTVDGIGDLCSSLIVGALWSFVSPLAGFLYATIISCVAMIMLLIRK